MPDTKPPRKLNFQSSDMTSDAFSLMNDAAKNAYFVDFATATADVCIGLHTCLKIIEASQHKDSGNPEADAAAAKLPKVTPQQAEALRKFAIVSTRLLHASAEKQVSAIKAHDVAQRETMMAIKKALKPDAE